MALDNTAEKPFRLQEERYEPLYLEPVPLTVEERHLVLKYRASLESGLRDSGKIREVIALQKLNTAMYESILRTEQKIEDASKPTAEKPAKPAAKVVKKARQAIPAEELIPEEGVPV